MRKLIVLLALIASGCSYYDSTEYEVTYSVLSSVPCSITYWDDEWITMENVTEEHITLNKTYYHEAGSNYPSFTPEFVIKERFCLGTIGISINGEGVTKTIGVSCCCEDVLRYSGRINKI